MRSNELRWLDAHGQAALVRSGEVSPSDLVAVAIEAIDALDPHLNCISVCDAPRAIGRAARLAPSPPFAGVPILLKDSTEYPGLPWAGGSRAFATRRGRHVPAFVARLEAAGFVVVGKTTMPEGGLLPSTESLLYGPTRNPWALHRSCAGSSGGAGAAVAAGLVPVAQASDGGGSIRLPAAACGVIGLKPSAGTQLKVRAPHPIEDFLVCDMPLTRSVRDTAALHHLVTDDSMPPLQGPSSRRYRIGLLVRGLNGRNPHPDVAAAVAEAARLCEAMGHEIVPFEWSFNGARAMACFETIWAALTAEYVGAAKGPFEPWTLGLVERFRSLPADALPRALAEQVRLRQAYREALGEVDIVLSPAAAAPTPPLGAQAPDRPFAALYRDVFDHIAYTPLHNLVGAPAIALPVGMDATGVPVGVMAAAAVGEDRLLLDFAFQIEDAVGGFRSPPFP